MDTPRPLPGVRQEPFPDYLPGVPVCPLPSPVLLTLMTPSWSTPRLPHKDRVGVKPLHSHCHINSHHDPDKQVGCCVTSTKQNRNLRPGKMGRCAVNKGTQLRREMGVESRLANRPVMCPGVGLCPRGSEGHLFANWRTGTRWADPVCRRRLGFARSQACGPGALSVLIDQSFQIPSATDFYFK